MHSQMFPRAPEQKELSSINSLTEPTVEGINKSSDLPTLCLAAIATAANLLLDFSIMSTEKAIQGAKHGDHLKTTYVHKDPSRISYLLPPEEQAANTPAAILAKEIKAAIETQKRLREVTNILKNIAATQTLSTEQKTYLEDFKTNVRCDGPVLNSLPLLIDRIIELTTPKPTATVTSTTRPIG